MKHIWYWYVIAAVLFIILGYTVRGYIDDSHIKPGTAATNTNAGNHPVYYTNINSTNENAIFDSYVHLETDPFIFIQKADTMTVYLDNRFGSTKIKQWYDYSGWMFGVGAEYCYSVSLAGLIGYHWQNLAVLATFAISTNLNIGAFGVWLP